MTAPGLTGAPATTYEVVHEGGTLRVTADTDRPYEAVVVTRGATAPATAPRR